MDPDACRPTEPSTASPPACAEVGCDLEAIVSYVWPGKPTRTYACPVHFAYAQRVAQAMGFVLGDVAPAEE